MNNEYYILFKQDMEHILKLSSNSSNVKNILSKDTSSKDVLEYYYPEDITKKYKYINDTDYKEQYKHFKLNSFKKEIYNNDSLMIKECYCKNIIFDSLSDKLNVNYNLANLYNNLTTSYYRPVIKYIDSSGYVKYIKINKHFLQKNNYQDLDNLLKHKYNNEFKIQNKEYIQWKWRLDNLHTDNNTTIIITIDFYENGYTVVYFDDEQKIPISTTLLKYLDYARKTIKNIKKIINATQLHLPNVTNIFSENNNRKSYSTLLKANIIVEGKIDITKIQSNLETTKLLGKLNIDLFIKNFKRHISRFHQLIIIKQNNNSLSLIYKQVNKFYSNQNIAQFISSYLKKNEKNEKTEKTEKT